MSLNLSSLLGGGLILRQQLITANGTWTRPATMAGDTVWLTMIGGGASGQVVSSVGRGGRGGQWIIEVPIDIGATSSVSCTIGAGGLSAAENVAFKPGGPTSFGAFVTMLGGAAVAGGAPGGIGSASPLLPGGGDTPLGYGGVSLVPTDARFAGGGGGLVLDASGISGGSFSPQIIPATGYGAGGNASYNGSTFSGFAGAPGAILVQWPEFI